jgi:hypothetical protein
MPDSCWGLDEESCLGGELGDCNTIYGQPFEDDGNGGFCLGEVQFAYCAPLIPCQHILKTKCDAANNPIMVHGQCQLPQGWSNCNPPAGFNGQDCQ